MASRLFDSSLKQLYAYMYIFMEDLAHDISESLNAHTYGISYAHNSYRCAQKCRDTDLNKSADFLLNPCFCI